MEIRAITSEDLKSVKEFLLTMESCSLEYSFAEHLAKNPGLSQVAIQDSKVVGCVLVSFDGLRGYFQNLVVDKEIRGIGLGQRLIAAGIAALKSQGCHEVVVLCHKYLSNWYEKQGFSSSERVIYTKTV